MIKMNGNYRYSPSHPIINHKKMMESIKESEKQPEITVQPYDYDFCACCLNCMSRDKCRLGEHGDFGVCKGYDYDRESGK